MTVQELIDRLKEYPQDATVAVYARSGSLPNIFIEDIMMDDYEPVGLGMIVDLVI